MVLSIMASGVNESISQDKSGFTIAGENPDTSAVPVSLNFTGALPYEAFKFQNTTFGIS